MKIDIVIPNYNGFSLIEKNLPFVVREAEKYGCGIIIVDDCSVNYEFGKLKNLIKKINDARILLIRNKQNMGFSSTVNRGISYSKAEFIVLLNTDVVPGNNFLDAAIEDLNSNKKIFGVGFLDLSIEHGKEVLRGRGIGEWKRGFLVHRRGQVNKKDTFWISGGSCIFRREFFEKLGGFDTLYDPFYWEDIDLSYRAKKSGFSILFEPKSIVEHKHEEGSIKKHYKDLEIKAIAYRNQFIFIWKNITDLNLILLHLLWLPYHFLSALARLDFPFFVGFLAAFARILDIIEKRSKQKFFYSTKDRDILSNEVINNHSRI